MLGSSKAPTEEEATSYGGYVEALRERMQRAHDIAQKHLGKNAIHTKEHYDAKCILTKYKQGDLVWYATDIKQLHLAPKLWVPFEGPYLILEKLSDLNCHIQLDANGKQKVVHHDKLKPYTGPRGLPWSWAALRVKEK